MFYNFNKLHTSIKSHSTFIKIAQKSINLLTDLKSIGEAIIKFSQSKDLNSEFPIAETSSLKTLPATPVIYPLNLVPEVTSKSEIVAKITIARKDTIAETQVRYPLIRTRLKAVSIFTPSALFR